MERRNERNSTLLAVSHLGEVPLRRAVPDLSVVEKAVNNNLACEESRDDSVKHVRDAKSIRQGGPYCAVGGEDCRVEKKRAGGSGVA